VSTFVRGESERLTRERRGWGDDYGADREVFVGVESHLPIHYNATAREWE
jgi:hypothetical protein